MSDPESLGFSAERLSRMDRVLTSRYLEAGLFPGLITQIYRGGELVHTGLLGQMDLERGKPMREDAIFRIYSMTKPITAVALMMLVEEGLIGLDDDVATHIPAWSKIGVYAGGLPPSRPIYAGGQSSAGPGQTPKFLTTPVERPMKVIDLATHTSGLTYDFNLRTSVDAAYRDLKIGSFQTPGGLGAFIEQLSALPLDFSPGTAWNYSVSIDVMGYLVQKLSGQSFGEFLQTRLFGPLGMDDTAFFCPPEKLDRFTTCYLPGDGGGLKVQDDSQESTFAVPPLLESGGGGLVSTTRDYMRFCAMMLNGGMLDGVQILSPKTVALFSLNHLPGGAELTDLAPPGVYSEAAYAGRGFSLGCAVNVDVAKTRLPGTLGEYFWGGAASTGFWIDPVEDLAVVVMTQVIGTPARLALRRDLRTLVYSAMTESLA
jgi:CubicO group peptidase (beta-lactamase class C family)